MTTTKSPNPKSVAHVEGEILRRVNEEGLSPGTMLPGFGELARQMGAAPGTVQRAVANLVSNGVLRSEKRRGTFVARPSGASSETENISQMVERERGLYGREPRLASFGLKATGAFLIAAGVVPRRELATSGELWSRRASSSLERTLQLLGHSTHTVNLMDRPIEDTIADIEYAFEGKLDGIAYMPDASRTAEESAQLERRIMTLRNTSNARIPMVQVTWSDDSSLPVDTVRYDGLLGSYLATKHLIDLGHKNIVFMGEAIEAIMYHHSWQLDRIRGFYRALYDAEIEWGGPDKDPGKPELWGRVLLSGYDDDIHEGWTNVGRAAWRRLCERGEMPSAVVAVNDLFACAVVEEARASGCKIPETLSIVGYDDRACSASINLTTIHVPVEAMGVAAANLLMQRRSDASLDRRAEIVLAPTIVARNTTRPFREGGNTINP